ncbi:uncharacterized protein LOC128223259 [Mya arenaria]|uniref:uncharacterized protein LOC128223259 n=1 Tax=Mya arenaria TaxID=6604 RepID=UPI0022E960AA|nr:uncharacterized protein LOC128223259 [Mya arenaria]
MLHKGTPVLDESMYHNYLGRIVGAVQRICDYMQEPDLKKSLLKEINKYESLRHIYTNGLISELGCKTVEIINEADAAVESGLQQMKTILQKKGLSVNIPVLDVIVMFRNYNKEDEQAITDRLLETFTEALKQGKEMADDQTADKLYVEVKSLVRKLFDEKKEITKVSRGCIILSIQCHDLDAVISLVQDSLSGKLGSLFEPLEEVIRTDAVHALFEVCVGITGQSCWALLNEMFCEVSDECEKRLFTVESTVQDDGIGVRIQRFLQSVTDKENLEKSFFSKEKKEIFMKIQEDLTIDLDQPGMKMVLSYPKNNEGAETEEPNVLLAKENEDGNGEYKRQNADTEMSSMSSKAFASSSGKPQSDTSKTELDRFGMEFTDILQPQKREMDVSPSMNDQTTCFKATQSRTINQSQTNDALIAQDLRSKTTNEQECKKDKVSVFSELLQTVDDIKSPNEEDDEEIKWSIAKYVDDRISPFYKLPSCTRLAKDEKHTTANTKTQADALKESVHDTKEYEEKYTRDRSFRETVFSEEMFEINIESDQDDIGRNVDDEVIHLRGYQEELAQKGCQGENVIVMAPAKSGKTRVACRIMQVHLRQKKAERKRGRILFLVENEALAIQQGEVCAELLPSYRTKVFSGNVHRLKKQMLWDFIERQVFIT